MKTKLQLKVLLLLVAGILAVFIGRAILSVYAPMPYSFQLFDTLTVVGSLWVVLKGYRSLQRDDWVAAMVLGLVIGVGMRFASLFSAYPFFGVVRSNTGQALLRGSFTTLVALGGLVVMRRVGPVQFHTPKGDWRLAGRALLIGLGVGLPLAVLNVFALQFTQGQAIVWQNPWAAMLDALQPGVFEEVFYRFALWGLFWLVLRGSNPERAAWLSGLLAMLVHNYSHFDDLFLQSPLAALGMGAVLAMFWGLPPLLLARRLGLESAIAFHWIQDVARFLVGF